MSGPCLSSSVAGHPLRPATRHRLGEPLPHQLTNRPRAHPQAHCCFNLAITCGINPSFPGLSHSWGQVTHVLLTRAPLKTNLASYACFPFDLHVLSTPPAFVLSQNQTLHQIEFFAFSFFEIAGPKKLSLILLRHATQLLRQSTLIGFFALVKHGARHDLFLLLASSSPFLSAKVSFRLKSPPSLDFG